MNRHHTTALHFLRIAQFQNQGVAI
jgi:hypothetical protein